MNIQQLLNALEIFVLYTSINLYVNLFHVGSCGVLFLYNYIKVMVGVMQFVSFIAMGQNMVALSLHG
jgi:hypothetical protein